MVKEVEDVTVKTYVEKIDKLVHNDQNPRKINDKQFKELLKSLKSFPEMKLLREIVVDENFLILAGDKRTWALQELGYTDVTIKQVKGLSESKKREFIVKDNDHSGEWDAEIIANSWEMEDFNQWGIKSFDFGDITDPKEPSTKDSNSQEVECPGCGMSFTP